MGSSFEFFFFFSFQNMSQQQDTFNNEELTKMALDIMDDLQNLSTKPRLDSADSYQFKLDAFQLVDNDIYSSLSTIDSQKSTTNYTQSSIPPQYKDDLDEHKKTFHPNAIETTQTNSHYRHSNKQFPKAHKTFSQSSKNRKHHHPQSSTYSAVYSPNSTYAESTISSSTQNFDHFTDLSPTYTNTESLDLKLNEYISPRTSVGHKALAIPDFGMSDAKKQ